MHYLKILQNTITQYTLHHKLLKYQQRQIAACSLINIAYMADNNNRMQSSSFIIKQITNSRKPLNREDKACLFVSSSVTTESRELESSTTTSRQFVVAGNVTAISGLTSASNTNFISVLGNRNWHLRFNNTHTYTQFTLIGAGINDQQDANSAGFTILHISRMMLNPSKQLLQQIFPPHAKNIIKC